MGSRRRCSDSANRSFLFHTGAAGALSPPPPAERSVKDRPKAEGASSPGRLKLAHMAGGGSQQARVAIYSAPPALLRPSAAAVAVQRWRAAPASHTGHCRSSAAVLPPCNICNWEAGKKVLQGRLEVWAGAAISVPRRAGREIDQCRVLAEAAASELNGISCT